MDFPYERCLLWAGSLLYIMAFGLALASLRQRANWRSGMRLALLAGYAFQSFGLFLRGLTDHALPVTNVFEIFQVLAWCAITLDLIVRPLFKLNLLHMFTAGLAGLLAVVSLFLVGYDRILPPPDVPQSPWVGFHAVLAIFSYGVFGVLALTSLMYIIQHHGLEARRSGGIFERLPAIRQLEDINGRLILFGVSVLTVSVVIGVLNLIAHPGSVGVLKVAVAIAVWACYGSVLALRRFNRLVGAPFAIACVALFAGALISLWPLTRQSPAAPLAVEAALDDA